MLLTHHCVKFTFWVLAGRLFLPPTKNCGGRHTDTACYPQVLCQKILGSAPWGQGQRMTL